MKPLDYLSLPGRGRLIVQIPLFVAVKPLARPRIQRYDGNTTIYQPLENQADCISEMCRFKPLHLALPVIVDHYYHFPQFRNDPFPTANKFGDEDNLRKAINDNLVRADILTDDRFIVGGEQYKLFSKEAFTLVLIWEANVPQTQRLSAAS